MAWMAEPGKMFLIYLFVTFNMNAPILVGFFTFRMSTCCLHTVTHRCFDPRSNSHGLDQVCQREKMNISNERILGSELHEVQRLLAACKRITSKERANNLSQNFSSHNWHVLTACRAKKRWDCFCYWFYTSFFLTNKFCLVKYKYDSKLDVWMDPKLWHQKFPNQLIFWIESQIWSYLA